MQTFHFLCLCLAWTTLGMLVVLSAFTNGSCTGTAILCGAGDLISSLVFYELYLRGR